MTCDSEQKMSSFAFDESKSIDQNLAAFFKHLESYNEEFAGHLRAKLDAQAVANFDRTKFNADIATMLDTVPKAAGDQQ